MMQNSTAAVLPPNICSNNLPLLPTTDTNPNIRALVHQLLLQREIEASAQLSRRSNIHSIAASFNDLLYANHHPSNGNSNLALIEAYKSLRDRQHHNNITLSQMGWTNAQLQQQQQQQQIHLSSGDVTSTTGLGMINNSSSTANTLAAPSHHELDSNAVLQYFLSFTR
jgi:hypothetical protein